MRVNEIFLSIQGEGVRVGSLNVFVRFSGCNLKCSRETEGFDCDTEFSSGRKMSEAEVLMAARELWPRNNRTPCVIFTGGEPGLQLTDSLVQAFQEHGWFTAVETNGTVPVPLDLDWVSCSPKTAEHTIRLVHAPNELRYVRCAGQGLPKPVRPAAVAHFLSPACQSDGTFKDEDVRWCVELIKEDPRWLLSIQTHKLLKLR